MTILTEKVRAGEFLMAEAEGTLSRDNITVSSGRSLAAGTVLGKVTASGEYVAYSNAASDGSEIAAGILYADVDATAADAKGVIINCLAEVDESLLIGIDAPGKVDLAAKFIKFR